jgi:hypothetical protein
MCLCAGLLFIAVGLERPGGVRMWLALGFALVAVGVVWSMRGRGPGGGDGGGDDGEGPGA